MISRAFVRELKRAVGSDLILDKVEDRTCYGFDATGIFQLPDVVVCPTRPEHVVYVVRLARREGLPITPRGAGTGYSGGAVPVRRGIVLAMERMNRIESVSRADGMAVVEAGVVNGVLQQAALRAGLFYPPDPASCEFSTLGGNIAECAGGPRALKYGVTRDYVAGLEFVTPEGALVRCGVLAEGSLAPYDLAGILSASEGTLGVITRCALRVIPEPPHYRTLLFSFSRLSEAAEAVVLLTSANVVPSVVELVDESCLKAVRSAGTSDLPIGEGQLLLVEVDGEEEEVEDTARRVERVAEKAGCTGHWTSSSESERENIWSMRRAISPALAKLSPTKVNEDVCVPRSQLSRLVGRIESLSREHDLLIPVFGHAGDGNLHVNFMVDRNKAEQMTRAERAVEGLLRATLDLGGTLSGEHGIGLSKAPFLEWEMGRSGLRLMHDVKGAVDPENLLNPGKVGPDGATGGGSEGARTSKCS